MSRKVGESEKVSFEVGDEVRQRVHSPQVRRVGVSKFGGPAPMVTRRDVGITTLEGG